MTKNIKILLAVLIGVPFLVYLGYQYNVDRVRQMANRYGLLGDYSGHKVVEEFYQEDSFLAITWQLTSDRMEYLAFSELKKHNDSPQWDNILGKNYLVRKNIRIRNKGLYAVGHDRQDDEYWTLDIYDIDELGAPPRTVDVLKQFETETRVVGGMLKGTVLNDEGEEFLIFYSYDLKKEMSYHLFNLETGESVSYVPRDKSSDIPEGYSIYPNFSLNLSVNTSVDGFAANGIRDGSWGFMLYPNTQREPNTFFRSFFPDIKGELTEDHQIFIRAETPLELLEAYEKFFKDPTELYRGLTLSSDYAVDGQEHVVQTKEEFLMFYRDPDKGGN